MLELCLVPRSEILLGKPSSGQIVVPSEPFCLWYRTMSQSRVRLVPQNLNGNAGVCILCSELWFPWSVLFLAALFCCVTVIPRDEQWENNRFAWGFPGFSHVFDSLCSPESFWVKRTKSTTCSVFSNMTFSELSFSHEEAAVDTKGNKNCEVLCS